MKIFDLDVDKLDEKWLINFISNEFIKPDENVTPMRILAKLGVGIHDQVGQLQNKVFLNKFGLLLKTLNNQGLLVVKENKHDTLGIKETAYTIV